MLRTLLIILSAHLTICLFSQEAAIDRFLSDSSMAHASLSLYIADSEKGEKILDFNGGKSLIPASVMKLITSAAAIELLGPQYTFSTIVGYTGSINKRSGKLSGNIVIRGGGDPSLGSGYFSDHYRDFLNIWVEEIKKLGIRKIEGRILTDDSYYDFLPVPAKWLWEDAGNYYGAGAYGLSVFDNSYEIHLNPSSDSSELIIMEIFPYECKYEFTNWLVAAGTSDEQYLFAAPYSTNGWFAGKVPIKNGNYILKASIADPPRLIARMLNDRLKSEGITISGNPTTVRLLQNNIHEKVFTIAETVSPPLTDIIEILNHESVNLYAEHLIKELGKIYKNSGSTAAGVEVIKEFLINTGIRTDGIFIEDGSGLSPVNSINAMELVNLLTYMKKKGKYFTEYYSSLPLAGKEGTLKNYFNDPIFETNMRAKSGSMTRVRSYSGYLTTLSNKDLIFCIIVNNYTGSYQNIISNIEEILKEVILQK